MTAAIAIFASYLFAGGEWAAFAPMGAGFKVAMPGQPERNDQSIKTAQGNIEIRFFTLTAAEGTYVAAVTEHPPMSVPPGQEQARLDQARDGAVKTAKGRLRWEKKLEISGCPAREFFVATETGHAIKVRLIANRNRLFQLMVVGNTRFLDSPEAVRFLESFRLAK